MSEATRGQVNRKEIRQKIESSLQKYCPENPRVLASRIAYDNNLSPDTVRYTYIPMFVDVGILEYDREGNLTLTAMGKRLQTTEDGLTEADLTAEYEEEIQKRAELKKPKITFEEWKKQRTARIKPVGGRQ